jgi:rhodanese-related sulfurtransferase
MFPEIRPSEVEKALKENKNLPIIDVREEGEVASGKIPGAKNIPLGQVLTRTQELDPNTEYIIVCRGGKRSSLACEWLADKGFKVKNLTGGMMNWAGDIE